MSGTTRRRARKANLAFEGRVIGLRGARQAPLLALFAIVCAAGLTAQSDDTIKVNVRLVRVLATVKNAAGQLIGGLNKEDFEVRDNGAPQQIAVFERETGQPLSVAILIDNSGSTAKDLRYETDSVTRFVKALVREGNPADSVALFTFNWEVVQRNGFTRDPLQIERSLRTVHGEAGTALYDAVLLASRAIEDRQGRKVLVVVTDGGDTVSRTDFNRATEAAQLADAVIYPILVVPIVADAGRNVGGENALATFALRTGGRVFSPTLGAEMDHAFDQILRDLRTQYLLGFYPKDVPLTADRYHTLKVGLRIPALHAVARSGYYGEALQDAPRAFAGASEGPGGPDQGGETVRPRKPAPPKKKGP
ncbi:MAG: VWA domain-containing protein [Acidobacteriota bacterium]|nr:VWA domain-containing protein [Acidobacteriota bacterium]